MGLTYTTAAQRDVQRTQRRTQHSAERFQPARLSLAVTSGVALLAITLAYFGRISVFEQWESVRAGVQPVNLSVVVDAGRLEPALGMVHANANDRRLAAEELLRFLVEERNQGRALTHVGAIARASVSPRARYPSASCAVSRSPAV